MRSIEGRAVEASAIRMYRPRSRTFSIALPLRFVKGKIRICYKVRTSP